MRIPWRDYITLLPEYQLNFDNFVDTDISIQQDTSETRVHKYETSLHAQPHEIFWSPITSDLNHTSVSSFCLNRNLFEIGIYLKCFVTSS